MKPAAPSRRLAPRPQNQNGVWEISGRSSGVPFTQHSSVEAVPARSIRTPARIASRGSSKGSFDVRAASAPSARTTNGLMPSSHQVRSVCATSRCVGHVVAPVVVAVGRRDRRVDLHRLLAGDRRVRRREEDRGEQGQRGDRQERQHRGPGRARDERRVAQADPADGGEQQRDDDHHADQRHHGRAAHGEGEDEERQARDEERARGQPGGEQLAHGDLGRAQERDLQRRQRAGVAVAVDAGRRERRRDQQAEAEHQERDDGEEQRPVGRGRRRTRPSEDIVASAPDVSSVIPPTTTNHTISATIHRVDRTR